MNSPVLKDEERNTTYYVACKSPRMGGKFQEKHINCTS